MTEEQPQNDQADQPSDQAERPEGKLADVSRANQPDTEDERARRLAATDEAQAEAQRTGGAAPVRDFGPESRQQQGPTQAQTTSDQASDTGQAQTDTVEVDVEQYAAGGGWYHLPNGEKVQGKEAAEEAMRSQ